MKEYKLVYLNKGLKFSRDKEIQQAEDLMMNAPSEVTIKQLRELHIEVKLPKHQQQKEEPKA